MKQLKLAPFLLILVGVAALAASNTIYPWDTFTDVKTKLAGGAASGSTGNDIVIAGTGGNVFAVTNFSAVALGAVDNLYIQTPLVTDSNGTVGKVLKLISSSGGVEFGAPYTYSGSKTYDAPSIATNGVISTTVTVTNCLPGDFVVASLSTVGTNAVVLSAQVSATNTVTVSIFNPTAAAVDLDSGTLRAATF